MVEYKNGERTESYCLQRVPMFVVGWTNEAKKHKSKVLFNFEKWKIKELL